MSNQDKLLMVSHLLRHNIAALRALRRDEPVNLSVLLNVPLRPGLTASAPTLLLAKG